MLLGTRDGAARGRAAAARETRASLQKAGTLPSSESTSSQWPRHFDKLTVKPFHVNHVRHAVASAPAAARRPAAPASRRRTAAPTPALCAACPCNARPPFAAPAAPAASSTAHARRHCWCQQRRVRAQARARNERFTGALTRVRWTCRGAALTCWAYT